MVSGCFVQRGFQRSLCAASRTLSSVATAKVLSTPAYTSYPASDKRTPKIKVFDVVNEGEGVDISFNDGSAFRFHAFWLRDACRDDNHLLPSMERIVSTSPIVAGVSANVKVQSIELGDDGESINVKWSDDDVVAASSFSATLLRAYAPRVAMALDREENPWVPVSSAPPNSWLDAFDSSIEPPRALDPASLRLLSNLPEHESRVPFVPYSWVEKNMEDFLYLITDPGAMIIDGMPEDAACDGSVFSAFASKYLGGLQKHPLRDDAHWTISTEQSVQISNSSFSNDTEQLAASNSYNTKLQLANHTDQALYGMPGLFLLFHCAMGEGNNSLVDGFAAAFALRERRPDLYALLTRYGANAGRRLGYYKNGIMSFNVSKPVIQTDANGDPIRIQYHEMYRTPLEVPGTRAATRLRYLSPFLSFLPPLLPSPALPLLLTLAPSYLLSLPRQVPYQDAKLYYEALQTWYNMTHSEEFQMHFKLQKGQMIIMNNWRMMHGRAGLEGKQRIILGGTVTRDAYYSVARLALQKKYGLSTREEVGLPSDLFSVLGGYGLPQQA
jgi:hypothetical protein